MNTRKIINEQEYTEKEVRELCQITPAEWQEVSHLLQYTQRNGQKMYSGCIIQSTLRRVAIRKSLHNGDR